MKSLTNKFILSVLSLVMTGVALSVGIYAWFTVNNVATVEAFTADVQSGVGLYISTDPTADEWVAVLTTADITALYDGFEAFIPVTTEDGIEFETITGSAAPVSGVLSFTLYFAASDGFGEVQITSLSIASAGNSWQPLIDVEGTRSEGNASVSITEYAANATRIAFVDLVAEDATIFEQLDAVTSGDSVNTLGVGDEEDNEAWLFFEELEPAQAAAATYPASEPYTVVSRASNSGLSVAVADLVSFAAFQTATGLTPDVTEISGVVGIAADAVYAAVTVNIWIEGWDAQAFNSILSDTLTVSFTFGGAA